VRNWSHLLQRLRLGCGLVLFAYVTTHFINHSLGLISLPVLEAGQDVFLAVWRNPPGTVLLYGSLAIHMLLGLWSLFRRRSLRMPAWEAAQLLLGLAIPPLLVLHILGTRIAHELYGTDDSYTYLLILYFVVKPAYAIQQAAALVVAWLHGCIGIHFWLRLKAWYQRWTVVAYTGALLVPLLAMLGFVVAGQTVATMAKDQSWRNAVFASAHLPSASDAAVLFHVQDIFLWGYLATIVLVLLGRWGRGLYRRRHGMVTVVYPNGRRVPIVRGTTILEASRSAGLPHASVCGGRGRCSTCRVRVGEGAEHLPPPSEEELRVLKRVGAPPGVRLACQTRPTRDIHVTPLLPATATPEEARTGPSYLQGQEREIAVLFADLRGFTTLSESKLPYDVVFVLNRYFRSMGLAVEEAGGRVDKFIGDGVMALFGLEVGSDQACRQALTAARYMAARLEELNEALSNDLPYPLRMGMGIHCGHAIVGAMGYGRATSVTAVGDTVNTASRLETLTKEFEAEVVVSDRVCELAGIDVSQVERHDLEVRGRRERLSVLVFKRARDVPMP
jgi:adenylate cyclase